MVLAICSIEINGGWKRSEGLRVYLAGTTTTSSTDGASKLSETRTGDPGPDLDPGPSLGPGPGPEADPATRRTTEGADPGPSRDPSLGPSPDPDPDRLRRTRRLGAGRGPDPIPGKAIGFLY